jgi:hypothetical protein
VVLVRALGAPWTKRWRWQVNSVHHGPSLWFTAHTARFTVSHAHKGQSLV